MAKRLSLAVVSATQTNRGGINQTQLSLTDVSESMGIGHTVDALFGILKQSIDDIKQKYLRIQAIALRNAPMPEDTMIFEMDFDTMTMTTPIAPIVTNKNTMGDFHNEYKLDADKDGFDYFFGN